MFFKKVKRAKEQKVPPFQVSDGVYISRNSLLILEAMGANRANIIGIANAKEALGMGHSLIISSPTDEYEKALQGIVEEFGVQKFYSHDVWESLAPERVKPEWFEEDFPYKWEKVFGTKQSIIFRTAPATPNIRSMDEVNTIHSANDLPFLLGMAECGWTDRHREKHPITAILDDFPGTAMTLYLNYTLVNLNTKEHPLLRIMALAHPSVYLTEFHVADEFLAMDLLNVNSGLEEAGRPFLAEWFEKMNLPSEALENYSGLGDLIFLRGQKEHCYNRKMAQAITVDTTATDR